MSGRPGDAGQRRVRSRRNALRVADRAISVSRGNTKKAVSSAERFPGAAAALRAGGASVTREADPGLPGPESHGAPVDGGAPAEAACVHPHGPTHVAGGRGVGAPAWAPR